MFFQKRNLRKYKLDFRLIRDIDKPLLFSMILLILYGMFNIYLCTKGSATSATAGLSSFFYVKKQAAWFIVSLIALYFFMAVDYRALYRYITVFYWASVVLLICMWIPGVGKVVNGARGWIGVGPVSLQPSEIAKYAIIFMTAKLLDEMDYDVNNIKNIIKIGIYAMIPVSFILIQPDMGMTMVIFFMILGMLFVAGLDRRVIIGGFATLIIGITVVWNTGLLYDHQKARITAFLNPETDDSQQGYQLNQSLITIGSGGLIGTKPDVSPDVAPGYGGTHVPEIQTDFIFAAVSEQFGFVGALVLLTLYGIIITRIILIAKNSKDKFASSACIGIVSYFMFAITQNVGMTLGLIPITGITLPFVSYGGSSLLTTVMAVALVLNIGMRKKKIRF